MCLPAGRRFAHNRRRTPARPREPLRHFGMLFDPIVCHPGRLRDRRALSLDAIVAIGGKHQLPAFVADATVVGAALRLIADNENIGADCARSRRSAAAEIASVDHPVRRHRGAPAGQRWAAGRIAPPRVAPATGGNPPRPAEYSRHAHPPSQVDILPSRSGPAERRRCHNAATGRCRC